MSRQGWSRAMLRRIPLLALALAMFVVGAVVVGHARHDAAPSASDQPAGTSSSSSSGSASAAASPAQSPSPSSSAQVLAAAADGRQTELTRLAKKAQKLSVKKLTEKPTVSFTFAQFNVQGASHRGNVGGRTAIARNLINGAGADVASVQEFAVSQQRSFAGLTGGAFGCYPCQSGPNPLDGENSVLWRKSRFDAIRLETRPYPYFGGSIRNMPWVLLRDKQTGTMFYVTSYHNPADVHGPAGKWRSIAVGRQAADTNSMRAKDKFPIIESGDMNDRAGYFCKMAGATGMHSADGSNYSGGCRVAGSPWIDWIMGSTDITFSGYRRADGGQINAASDHPFLSTQVTITGRPGDGRSNPDGSIPAGDADATTP